jgi:hypothetical protein
MKRRRRRQSRLIARSAECKELQACVGKRARFKDRPEIVGVVAWSGRDYNETIGIERQREDSPNFSDFDTIESIDDIELIE